MMKTIIVSICIVVTSALCSCSSETSKPIQFVGILSNTGDMIILTSQSGGKGIFKKADILNELSSSSTNTEYSIQLRNGSEVEINGTKLIVGKDLLDPNDRTLDTKPPCRCREACGGGGSGQCCAVSGYKTKCVNNVCQYTMDRCNE